MAQQVTYLPDQKVRYSYKQPSMSRRGGVRLHPVKDGVINPQSSQQYLRTRDIGGNKLVDVVDPETGYVIGTRSLIESAATNPAGCSTMKSGVSGTASGTLKLLADQVRVDSEGHRVYCQVTDDGRTVRIRTTDQGEGWVGAVPRSAQPDVTTRRTKEDRSVSARAPKQARRVPGATGRGGTITDADVESFIRALARRHNRPEPSVITPNMMRDGREALKRFRRQAAQALAKMDQKG